MTQLPKFSNYGKYSNDNYGAHCLRIDLDTIELWYSYETIIAYRDIEDGLTIRHNDWSTTTGKHLNWIDPDKSKRISGIEFEARLQSALARHIV